MPLRSRRWGSQSRPPPDCPPSPVPGRPRASFRDLGAPGEALPVAPGGPLRPHPPSQHPGTPAEAHLPPPDAQGARTRRSYSAQVTSGWCDRATTPAGWSGHLEERRSQALCPSPRDGQALTLETGHCRQGLSAAPLPRSSSVLTGKLVRKARPQASLQTHGIRNSGVGSRNLCCQALCGPKFGHQSSKEKGLACALCSEYYYCILFVIMNLSMSCLSSPGGPLRPTTMSPVFLLLYFCGPRNQTKPARLPALSLCTTDGLEEGPPRPKDRGCHLGFTLPASFFLPSDSAFEQLGFLARRVSDKRDVQTSFTLS